ncbi:MAG: AbrB/MazE/SpoVT family DNA-binding domain-containing protein [Trichloromonadaceae bacterium]
MRENAVVSSRGQITLPAGIRKRLGIKPGAVVILEDRDGELVIRPAAVVAVEMYSDRQIAEWDADDQLAQGEREEIRRRLAEHP